jgi:hypothetical protein
MSFYNVLSTQTTKHNDQKSRTIKIIYMLMDVFRRLLVCNASYVKKAVQTRLRELQVNDIIALLSEFHTLTA